MDPNNKIRSIFEYDRQAINFGYFNKAMKGDMTFCTDDDMVIFQDCQRWDISSTPILFAAHRLNNVLNQVAIMLAEIFALNIDPERKGGKLEISDVVLTNTGVLKILDQYVKELFSWFNEKARSIQIEAASEAYGPQNKEAIDQARFAHQRDQIKAHGAEHLLFALLPPFRKENSKSDHLANIFAQQFSKNIRQLEKTRPHFRVTEAEEHKAKSIAKAFFDQLHNEIMHLMFNIMGNAQFDDPDFQLPIEEALQEIARTVILSTDDIETIHGGSPPKFIYEFRLREGAVQMLNPSLGLLADWSYDSLRAVTADLKQLMQRAFGNDKITGPNIDSLPREQRQWFLEQSRILNTIMHMSSRTRTPGEKRGQAKTPNAPGKTSLAL